MLYRGCLSSLGYLSLTDCCLCLSDSLSIICLNLFDWLALFRHLSRTLPLSLCLAGWLALWLVFLGLDTPWGDTLAKTFML